MAECKKCGGNPDAKDDLDLMNVDVSTAENVDKDSDISAEFDRFEDPLESVEK